MSIYPRDCMPSVPSFKHIDFDQLEKATRLKLNEDLRRDVRLSLSMFEGDQVASQNVPTKNVRRKLEIIAKQCGELESILRIQYEHDSDESLIEQAAWK